MTRGPRKRLSRPPRFGAPLPDPLLALLPKARRRWASTDPILHAIAKEHPPRPRPETREDPFAALVSSIAHQQVSLAAGRAIYARLESLGGSPDALLAAGPDGLRAAGLSRPKVAYVLDLSERVRSGALDLSRLGAMTDTDIIAALTEVKGIGVWTARMFLIFHLARPDVVAPEDLGLQIAVARAYKVPRNRAAAKMTKMARAWSPYGSVASLTLWNWRRVLMEREKTPPAAPKPRARVHR